MRSETGKRISLALTGRKLPQSHKDKISAAHTGKVHSEAHTNALRGRVVSETNKAKVSIIKLGRFISDDEKLQMWLQFKDGASTRQIAKAHGIKAHYTVMKYLKRFPGYAEIASTHNTQPRVRKGPIIATEIHRQGTIDNLKTKGHGNRNTIGVDWGIFYTR